MNELTKAIAEAFVLWESIWRPPSSDLQTAAKVWTAVMEENGITVEQFRKSSSKIAGTCRFWPTPRDVLDACKETYVLPEHRLWKPLPMPKEELITPEQKREVLAQMKNPEAAKLLLRIIHGGEDERSA